MPSGAKAGWSLNPEAFARLLDHLATDRDQSAVAYERLRHRLIGLLQWWGAPHADELADETLDRMARKLQEGAVITEKSVGAYARGIARLVFLESTRRPSPQPDALDHIAAAPASNPEASLECFDGCLASLAEHDRRLVLRYYGDGKAKDIRTQLAGELGLSMTALRIRVHRLRERLERCTAACLAGGVGQ